MINQIHQDSGSGVGELPDYESSLQNLMRLDQTLQRLDGLLGNGMGPKFRDRFKKRRLIKQNSPNNSSVGAILQTKSKVPFHNITDDASFA